MPGGWIVQLTGRRACQTLMISERFAVAVEDESAAVIAVVPYGKELFDVRIETKSAISEDELQELMIGSGGVRRH